MHVDYRLYRHPAVLTTLVALTVIGLVAVFLGPTVKGAQRWLGVAGLGVQPSEFAKLVAVLFTAAMLRPWLERGETDRRATLWVAAVVGLFVVLIVKEPDFGSALALTAITGAMLFTAGLAYKWVAAVVLTTPWLAYAVLLLEPYRYRRLIAFWDPWNDREGAGYQVVQSLIAVGTGGLWGKGFMKGVQKLFYLPEAHNDFIYAVIAEETGAGRGDRRARLLLRDRVARAARGPAGARRARCPARLGDHGDARAAGAREHQRGARACCRPRESCCRSSARAGSSMMVSLAAMGILLNVSQHTMD